MDPAHKAAFPHIEHNPGTPPPASRLAVRPSAAETVDVLVDQTEDLAAQSSRRVNLTLIQN
jgi:hypothetical protein